MTPPNKYFYTFKSSDGAQVKVLRGDGPPKIVGGLGGWSMVARPRRTSITQWAGREPYQMDVPVLFDGWHDGNSVETDIRTLNKMAIGMDYDPPPTVTISGALPVGGATWVINAIDWGDDVYWQQTDRGQFYRLRQDALVHLIQYQAVERLQITVTKSLPNSYTVFRKGETLRSIAKSMYGDGSRWKDIQKANPSVRDPNKLPLKKSLRIP
jgi:hypothetical protein